MKITRPDYIKEIEVDYIVKALIESYEFNKILIDSLNPVWPLICKRLKDRNEEIKKVLLDAGCKFKE